MYYYFVLHTFTNVCAFHVKNLLCIYGATFLKVWNEYNEYRTPKSTFKAM
jgi:hypothetical protein